MKCIEMNGEIKRVPDAEAFVRVKSGWKFVAKHIWREKQGKSNPVVKAEVPKETEAKPEVPKETEAKV